MKPLSHLRTIALFLSLLVISLPFALAEEFSRIYDLNGNLISDGKFYREYNGMNQLVKVRLGNTSDSPLAETYLWHPIEERIVIKKVYHKGVLNYTVYYPTREFVRIVNSSGTFDEVYVHQENQLVAFIDADGNKNFVHSDHIGSISLLTDENGNVLEETFYSPYGEILNGGKKSRFDYEGKEFDSVVEDYDFHFRKYNPDDPPIFNQPDTLIVNVFDPQSLNRYMFERANPYGNVDPDGHGEFFFWTMVGIVVLNVVVYVGGGFRDYSTAKNWEKYEQMIREAEQEKGAQKVIEASKNVELSSDSYAAIEGPFKVGDNANLQSDEQLTETQVTTINIKKEENEDDTLIEDKKIKDDKLPDANKLVNQVKKKEEEKSVGVPGGGGGGGSGGNPGWWADCSQSCTTTCNKNGACTTKCKWVCTTK